MIASIAFASSISNLGKVRVFESLARTNDFSTLTDGQTSNLNSDLESLGLSHIVKMGLFYRDLLLVVCCPC